MAIQAGDVNFAFTGDTTELDKATKKATKGLAGVGKEATTTGKKLKKDLDKNAKTARKRLGDLGETAGDADSVMQGFSAALDMVHPGLGEVARTGGDALAAVESIGRSFTFANPVFLGLAAAAAVLGAAFVLLSEEEEEVVDHTEALTEASDNLSAALVTLTEAQADLHSRSLLASGAITDHELALAEAAGTVADRYKPALDAVNESIIVQGQSLEWARKKEIFNLEAKIEHTKAIKSQEEALRALKNQRADLIKSQFEDRKQEQQNINDIADRKAAEEEAADAEAEAEKARKAAASAAKTREAEALARAKDLNAVEELAAKFAEDKLTDAEKITAEYEKQIKKIDELIAKYPEDSEMYAEANEAKTEADQRRDRDLEALKKKQEADAAAAKAKADAEVAKADAEATTDAEKKAAEELAREEKRQRAIIDGTAQIADATSDAFALMLENEKIASSDAAKHLFRLQKAAAIASILIKTQEGLMTAATLPPPADVIKAVAVYASAGVATAAVLATEPTYHSGGIVRAPDEVGITAQTGEGVINRIGMSRLGEQGLAEINAGGGTSGGVIVNQWKHRIYQDFVRDELSQTGSPLRQAIKDGSRVGQL